MTYTDLLNAGIDIQSDVTFCFFDEKQGQCIHISREEGQDREILYIYHDEERFPIEQTVNSFSGVDLAHSIGFDIEALREKFTGLWDQIFVGENFLIYLRFLLFYLMRILYYACLALLVVVLCAIPVILTWDDVDIETTSDTLPLRLFKRFIARPCRVAWDWVKDFWEFFIYSGWRGLFILVWLVNVGALSILISFSAYYFWLLTFFDFSTIGVQLLKLAADLLLGLHTLPWFIWAPLFIRLYDRWRQAHGMDKLHHLDARNKGLLNEMPMCMFIVAPPRTGKDAMGTDWGITFAALDRDKHKILFLTFLIFMLLGISYCYT